MEGLGAESTAEQSTAEDPSWSGRERNGEHGTGMDLNLTWF